jgi:general stress protein 26
MSVDAEKSIEEYLASHTELHLATVSPDGRLMAHTMAYVSEGAVVWLFTSPNSRKVNNIRSNKSVAYTVFSYSGDMFAPKAIQMEGNAQIVTDRTTIERVMGMVAKKYPEFASMPMNPEVFAIIKIDPVHGYFLDYGVAFGYRAEAVY